MKPSRVLGAVEISPLTIPGVTVPEFALPGVDEAGFEIPAESVPPVEIPAVHRRGVRSPQVCQQRVQRLGSEVVLAVASEGIARRDAVRRSAQRPSVARASGCGRDGQCIPRIDYGHFRLPAMRLDAVYVNGRHVPGHVVPGSAATRFDERDRVAFQTPADVLFDTDRWELRPDVVETLRVIGEQLRSTTGPITVEGHTDARASEEHNQELSERRAASVRDWLVQAGIDPARITTKGYGESVPVAPNDTPEHLQQNRRVVVSVATGDG